MTRAILYGSPRCWDDLDPLARPILENFVGQRLLLKTERDGVIFLEVAHEAIFRCWPMLNGWLKASADVLPGGATSGGTRIRQAKRTRVDGTFQRPICCRQEVADHTLRRVDRGGSQVDSRLIRTVRTRLDRNRVCRCPDTGICVHSLVAERGGGGCPGSGKAQLGEARIELADAGRTRGDLTDTAFYYWQALDGMEKSDQWNESVCGLLASWMRRAGRPFLYDWRPRTGAALDHDVFPMDDRFQSRLFPVAFSPDGAEVLTVSQDRTIRIWNSSTGQFRVETGVHDSPIRDIAFSSGGGAFAVHCSDNTIWTWEVSSAKLVGKLSHDEGPIGAFACTSDGKKVLLGCLNNYVRLWDVSASQPCTSKLQHNLSVNSVTISHDDRILVTSGAGIKAWDARGQPLWAIDGLTEFIQAGPDSKTLLEFGERPPNQYVRQLDITTGKDLNARRIDARLRDEVLNGECSCLAGSAPGLRPVGLTGRKSRLCDGMECFVRRAAWRTPASSRDSEANRVFPGWEVSSRDHGRRRCSLVGFIIRHATELHFPRTVSLMRPGA